MFTPNPNLAVNALSGGINAGSRLADIFQQRQDRKKLSQLAELFGQGNYEQVGAGLVGMGQVGQGVNVANIPYQREQQALQRDFQNAQFMNQQQQQQIANELAQQRLGMDRDRLGMQRQRFDAEMDPNSPLNVSTENWTTPTQAVGPDGQPVYIQTSNRGGVRKVEGFTPNNPIKTIDNGNEILTVDSRTGQTIAVTPKDNYTPAFDKESGKQRAQSGAEARSNLPKVESQANQMLTVIDRLEKDPNMESALGVVQGRLPSIMANPMNAQGVEDFRAIKSQLEGQAFLQAFESLKGGGQITEIEGRKATDAMAAMRDTQSPQEFRRQLAILKDVIENGVRRARKSAQSPAPTSSTVVNVPSPMTAGATPQDAIQISSEADLSDSMIGKYVTLNGQTFKVEAD